MEVFSVHHWDDLGIILPLLVMNGVVGFWEEYQAGNTIAPLKAKLALKARVKRDGVWIVIPARELVPGDIDSVLCSAVEKRHSRRRDP